MAELVPIEQPNPEDMDLADLRAAIDHPNAEDEPTTQEEEPTLESADSEESAEVPAEQEATGEVEEEVAVEAEAEEAEEPEPKPERTIEDVLAELEQVRAERDHFDSVAGRHGGDNGHLRGKLKEAQERIARLELAQAPSGEYSDPPPVPQQQPQQQRMGSAADAEFAQGAMNLGVQAFQLENPGVMVLDEATGQKVLDKDLYPALQESGADLSHVFESGDGGHIMQQTKLVLTEAYRKLQADRIAKDRAQRSTNSVDQAAKLKQKKRTSAAASGGSAKAHTKPKPVNPETMPMKDLRAEIERQNE